MVRRRIPPAAQNDRGDRHREGKGRAPRGLQLVERDGYWHVVGTLRAGGRSVRIRRSLGLPYREDTREDAELLRLKVEGEIRDEVVHGRRPSVPVAIAARDYLKRTRSRPLGRTDVDSIKQIAKHFAARILRDVPEGDWVAFVERRQQGNAAATRERYINTLLAFLAWCQRKPRLWLEELPTFDRDKAARNPNRRARRRVQDLAPGLIMRLIEAASPHLRAQLAVEWSTGARVSSILHGCRLCDLILAEGREQLVFHDTKNGTTVTAALHPWAAEQLAAYLKWRGALHDREAPLFLTHRKKPYSDSGRTSGTQNKTAFNAAKRRAARQLVTDAAKVAAELRGAGRPQEADELFAEAKAQATLLGSVTQHWFRHLLATNILSRTGDIRLGMEQGGWLDPRSLIGYTHDAPERRRAVIAAMDIGAPQVSEVEARSKDRA